MSLLTLLILLLSLMLDITAANAQRFGGGATGGAAVAGGARGGISVQAGQSGAHTRSHFGGPVIATPVPRAAFVPAPHVHSPASLAPPHAATQPTVVFNGASRVFVAPVAPQTRFHTPVWHPHAGTVWRGHPGVVILDVPYASEGTVITQVAPGVIQQERRPEEVPARESGTRTTGQLAPFDPTPHEVVERMLALANVRSGETLYDLGAGDGRVVIAAAKKYRIKAVGYEIDPGLAKLARENVHKHGLEKLVEIRQRDFLSADLSSASVVTLYLSYDGNLALRSKLMRELKPGARVVSYTFDMAEWQPKIAEQYRDGGGNLHMIYLWQAGEPLAFR